MEYDPIKENLWRRQSSQSSLPNTDELNDSAEASASREKESIPTTGFDSENISTKGMISGAKESPTSREEIRRRGVRFHDDPPPVPLPTYSNHPALQQSGTTDIPHGYDRASVDILPPPPPPPPPPGPPGQLDMYLPAGDENININPASAKIYDRFMQQLHEFVALQANVIRSRVAVQEKRAELRIFRDSVSKSDIEFMDHLRVSMAEGKISNDRTLKGLFEAAQSSRDKVGPLEVEYEALETKLGAEEFALQEKYDDVEVRFQHFFRLHATTTTMPSHPSSISFEQPTDMSAQHSKWDEQEAYAEQPLFQGSAVGQTVKIGEMPVPMDPELLPGTPALSTIQKPLGSASAHRVSSTSQENIRNQQSTVTTVEEGHGRHLLQESEHFHPTPIDWKSGGDQMKTQGIMDALKGIGEAVSIPEDLSEAEKVEGGFGEGESLLLLGDDSETQSTLSDYLMHFSSTRDRINSWLLHKLRVSPWEVFELQREVSVSSKYVPAWAQLALEVWQNDGPVSVTVPVSISEGDDEHRLYRKPQPQPQPFPSIPGQPSRKHTPSSEGGDRISSFEKPPPSEGPVSEPVGISGLGILSLG